MMRADDTRPDVVKSRVQLRETPPTGLPWTYISNEVKAIVAEGGIKGLFRGLTPSCESLYLYLLRYSNSQ